MFDLSLPLSVLLLILLLWLLMRIKRHDCHKPATHGHDDCSFFTREYRRDEE